MKKMTREQYAAEQLKILANSITQKCDRENIKVLGISTSLPDQMLPKKLLDEMINYLKKENKKIGSIEFDSSSISDISGFAEQVGEAAKENDYVLVLLPTLRLYANAVLCSQKCDAVLLIERYAFTCYKSFEKTLSLVKENGIKILGAATCK